MRLDTLKKMGNIGIAILFIALSVQLGFSLLSPVMQYYIEALSNPKIPPPEQRQSIRFTADVIWYLAFNIAAFMLFRAPFATVFGRLSDKIGRKKLIVLGLFLYVLIGIALGLATDPLQVVIIRALQGIGSAMVWPVAETLLMEGVSQEIRARAMTLYVMSLNLANLIGPGLGGWIYNFFYLYINSNKAIDILRPTVLSPVPMFILAFLLSLTLKETTSVKNRSKEKFSQPNTLNQPEKQFNQQISKELLNRSINVVYFTGITNGFGVGLVSSIVVVYISEFVVKEPSTIGSLMVISGTFGLLAAYPIATYADKSWGKKNMAILSMLLRTLAFLILPFAYDIPTILVVLGLGNLSFNIGMPSTRAIQADLTKKAYRGKVFGQQQSFFNVGMGLGSLIGAALYIYYAHTTIFILPGSAVLFFTSAFLSLLSAIAIQIWLYEPSRQNIYKNLMQEGSYPSELG